MNLPARHEVILPDWPAPARVRAASTLRTGGASREPYASLNLATHVGDDAANVARNRKILSDMLDLPTEPLWLRQVHGTKVLDLELDRDLDLDMDRDSEGSYAVDRGEERARAVTVASRPPPTADGAVTSRSGLPCVVLTADCLPVLLCDQSGTRVGAAHAGWRGLAGGVLEAAVRRMAVEPDRILAWIGPGIGREAYEVGDEVREQFAACGVDAKKCFTANANGRWQADLCELARQRLRDAGVSAIHGGQWCTHSESARYFSHRRQAPCGRMATLVWLDDRD